MSVCLLKQQLVVKFQMTLFVYQHNNRVLSLQVIVQL